MKFGKEVLPLEVTNPPSFYFPAVCNNDMLEARNSEVVATMSTRNCLKMRRILQGTEILLRPARRKLNNKMVTKFYLYQSMHLFLSYTKIT